MVREGSKFKMNKDKEEWVLQAFQEQILQQEFQESQYQILLRVVFRVWHEPKNLVQEH